MAQGRHERVVAAGNAPQGYPVCARVAVVAEECTVSYNAPYMHEQRSQPQPPQPPVEGHRRQSSNPTLSVFHRADDTGPARPVRLTEVLRLIETDNKIAIAVAKIRSVPLPSPSFAALDRDAQNTVRKRRTRTGLAGALETDLTDAEQREIQHDRRGSLKLKLLPAPTFGAAFTGRRRKTADYTPSGLTVVDVDGLETTTAGALRDRAQGLPGCLAAFLSPSGQGVKFVVRLDPVPADASGHDHATRHVMAAYAEFLGQEVDPSGKDVTRVCYLSHDPALFTCLDAVPFTWDPAASASTKQKSKTTTLPKVSGPDAVRLAPQGERNTVLNHEVYAAALTAPLSDVTKKEFTEAAITAGLNAEESVRTIASACDAAEAKRRKKATAHIAPLDTNPSGLAEQLLEEMGNELLLITDPTEVRRPDLRVLDTVTGTWRPGLAKLDAWLRGLCERRIGATAVALEGRALSAAIRDYRQADRNGIDELLKRVGGEYLRLRNKGRAEHVTACSVADLDADMRFIGCANGVVDLREARSLSAAEARCRLITGSTPVPYHPYAGHSPEVRADVERLFRYLPESLARWWWDCLAYAICGLPAKRLYIGIGGADAGKTTLLEALRAALGVLCPKAQPDIFDAGRPKGSRGLSPELACFEAPARIVIIDELEGRRLTVNTVKTITGAYELTYTPLFSKPVTRRRTATAVVVSNRESTPTLSLHDSGMRSRVMPIPYPVVPLNALDPAYRNRMNQPDRAAALLAKLVETCARLQSYTEPPPPPGDVVAELKSLVRAEAGELGVFARRFAPVPDECLTVRDAWVAWCAACDTSPDSDTAGGIKKDFLSRQLAHHISGLPKTKPTKVGGKTLQAWRGWALLKEKPVVEGASADMHLSEMLATPSHWEGDGPLPSVQDLVSFAASGKVPKATWIAVLKSAVEAHVASKVMLPAAPWALVGASLHHQAKASAPDGHRRPVEEEAHGPSLAASAAPPVTVAVAQLEIIIEGGSVSPFRIKPALRHQDLVCIHATWRRCPAMMTHPLSELVVSWRRQQVDNPSFLNDDGPRRSSRDDSARQDASATRAVAAAPPSTVTDSFKRSF